ncbi:hypothetical protein CRUP_038763 [Coryphaenoides rupestris]|nr:hypothetical protein CRUP_038763 [Coryphaenoides rupestris]
MGTDELSFNHSELFVNGSLWFTHTCTLELDLNARRIILFLLYLLVFMVGLAENLLVVWVNWRRRHSANGVLFCVINVSLSDLTVIAVLPFFILEVTLQMVWLWGRFLCKVTNLIYMVNFYSSSFFLALMTLERYLSLAHPAMPALFPVLGRRRWLLCAGVWLFSLFLALLEHVHVDLLEWNEPGCFMMPAFSFIEWFTAVSFLALIFQFVVPAAVIVGCNVLIARAVRTVPDVQGRREVWLVHVYSLVFLVCWGPYHLVTMLMLIDDLNPTIFSCNTLDFLYYSYSMVQCLSLFHCVANPILYNFLSKSFRDNLANDVINSIQRESLPETRGQAGSGKDDCGGTGQNKQQRRLSEGSTSHSDVGS